MLSEPYEPTEVDRRSWLHVPSGTLWSCSTDTHQVVEIQKRILLKPRSHALIYTLYVNYTYMYNLHPGVKI